jgi:NodT family efflux transporter outer membrane factor (OMF) lipoprotein
VSFAPDIFGGNRRQVESLMATADVQRFELDATYLTLINNVIAAVVQVAGLQEQLGQTERMVALNTESLEVLRHSLALGAVAGTDVAAQETALAQAQATVPALRHQLEVQRHQLAALVGKLPADSPVLKLGPSDLQLPTEIPLSMPSRLVEHRPDVLAAAAQLHAATAQVGVAIADMLPQFDITGGIGSVATLMSDLFKSGTGFWSADGSLTQTLFAGGELLHKKRAADAMLDEAGASYRATVLGAFQNVADSLHALTSDAETLEASARAARAAQNGFDIARRQLELGSVNYLFLLIAEQTQMQAQIALVVARTNRLTDTAALFQALGGAPVMGPSP